jgi:hypothetical protein
MYGTALTAAPRTMQALSIAGCGMMVTYAEVEQPPSGFSLSYRTTRGAAGEGCWTAGHALLGIRGGELEGSQAQDPPPTANI